MKIKTSIEVRHEYAIGNLEDIKKGDMLGKTIVKRTYNLEEAVSAYESNNKNVSSLIHVPNLIGVYRRAKIAFSPDNPTGEVTRDCASEPYEGFEVHPSLVQIGFDPESFKVGVICDYIGDESRRMVIVPYKNLKSGTNALKKFSKLTAKRLKGFTKSKEFSKEERREYLTLIRELLKADGLTNPDYDAFINSSSIILL